MNGRVVLNCDTSVCRRPIVGNVIPTSPHHTFRITQLVYRLSCDAVHYSLLDGWFVFLFIYFLPPPPPLDLKSGVAKVETALVVTMRALQA